MPPHGHVLTGQSGSVEISPFVTGASQVLSGDKCHVLSGSWSMWVNKKCHYLSLKTLTNLNRFGCSIELYQDMPKHIFIK